MAIDNLVQTVMIRIVSLLTILFLGIIIARAARTLISRAFYEARALKIVRMNVGFILARVAEWAIYIATIVILANELGVTKIALVVIGTVIGIILVGNIVLALVFALPNIIARRHVPERKRKVGEGFNRKGVTGVIVRKRLTDLTVKSDTDELLILPYKSLVRD